ncbi:FtsK/SpoIIIE domain-containing protein [Jannaschia sp. R86511]|uniref:FtsK/SpoIIIE domain-containing protein n=1 Tax=Jannaschia sp. R86511 TaxID=3093853 RepID=UPI0036D2DAA0
MNAALVDAATWAGVAFFVLVGTLLLWAVVHRRSFRAGPGRVLGSAWAHHVVYGPRWPALARRHGLAASDRVDDRRPHRDDRSGSRPAAPRVELVRLRSVRREAGRDRLRLALPSGISPDDVRDASDSLAHALRARSCTVRADRPGQVWLDVRRRDHLTAVVPSRMPGAMTTEEARQLLDGVVVGRDENGHPWCTPVRGSHTLIAGTTGSGKSSLLWSLVCGLLPVVDARLLHLTWLDPKGGMEADAARLVANVVDRVDEMADHLEDLVTDLDARAAQLAGTVRTHHATPASPHHLIVIDELATITALADAKTARRVEAALGALLSRGRAVGFTVITTTVDPGKDVVRWRGLHATRVAFRLDEPIQVDMVLGDGARQRGARCDEISLAQAGVAYVRVDGHPDPVRVRAAYLDDNTIRDRITASAHLPAATGTTALPDEGVRPAVDAVDEDGTADAEVLR